MKKQLIAISSVLFCTGHALAVTTDSSPAGEELVNAMFGPNSGVTISNVNLFCSPTASGTFTDGEAVFGLKEGIVLSTGNIDYLSGPNYYKYIGQENGESGDPELEAIAGIATHDACVLEFDLDVNEGISEVSFDYVFSSEEYNESVGTDWNDSFALFADGENIALLPDGMPVSINKVNNQTNPGTYIDNDGCQDSGTCPINTEMNGLTKVLTAKLNVVPGESHHIKMAIADASDWSVDSNALIKGTAEGSWCEEGSVVNNTTTTGIMLIKSDPNTDQAQFKLKGVTDIRAAAKAAVQNGESLSVKFGDCGQAPAYALEVESNQLNLSSTNLRYTVGGIDVVRCVFSTQECVVNIKNADFNDALLDSLLTGNMTVSFKVGETNYINAGTWTQAGTKYRKDI